VGLKAHRGVVPVIAPLWQCRIHPISSNCPDSVYLRGVFLGWSKIADRMAGYFYTTPGPFTFPGPLALAEEIRWAHDCGGLGWLRENQFTPQVNWAMLNWMEIKLLWNVHQDPVKLRRQFLEGYYGRAAAESVEKVYESLETGLRSTVNERKTFSDDGTGLHSRMGSELLKPLLAKCQGDIDAALQAAQSGPEVFRHRVTRDLEALRGQTPAEF
jgi:hypothetical protein